jgi:hypothetical protein
MVRRSSEMDERLREGTEPHNWMVRRSSEMDERLREGAEPPPVRIDI